MEGTTAVTLLLMTFPSEMAIVWDFVHQLIPTSGSIVATLVCLRHSVWDFGDAVGMILFQMFLIVSTTLVHARVSFQLTGMLLSSSKVSFGQQVK